MDQFRYKLRKEPDGWWKAVELLWEPYALGTGLWMATGVWMRTSTWQHAMWIIQDWIGVNAGELPSCRQQQFRRYAELDRRAEREIMGQTR